MLWRSLPMCPGGLRRPAARRGGLRAESGQALVLVLALVAVLVLGTLVLAAFGQALGGKSRHQRAADLAAVSAASSMRRDYPRLFEPAMLEEGVRNPKHLSTPAYLARARDAAVRGGRRNGVQVDPGEVSFPRGFAPTRVSVRVRGTVEVQVGGGGRRHASSEVAVKARAAAELRLSDSGPGMPGSGSGGGYSGPLAYRTGKP